MLAYSIYLLTLLASPVLSLLALPVLSLLALPVLSVFALLVYLHLGCRYMLYMLVY